VSQYLGNIGSYKLHKKELEKLDLDIIFPDSKTSGLRKLFDEILKFNLHNNQLQKNFSENYSNDKDALNTLRVTKSRLNSYLEEKSLYSISRNYHIFIYGEVTLEQMSEEYFDFFKDKNIKIKEMKIFDTYSVEDNDKKPFDYKNNLFNDRYKEEIKKVLSNNGKVSFISVFDSKENKNFIRDLLFFDNKNLNVKYIRKPSAQSLSLVYMLIEDYNGYKYIVYYDYISKWSLVTKVSKKIYFSEQFYEILLARFQNLFNNQELEKNNEIIPITFDMFEKNKKDEDKDIFESHITNIVKDISNVMSINDTEKLKVEVNLLILKLKKINVIYPQMYFSNLVIHYYIRLIEIIHLVEKNQKKRTTFVFNQLLSKGIIGKLNKKIQNLFISKDKLLVTNEDFEKIDFNKLKIKLHTEFITQEKTISDIFSDLNWNTKEKIIQSFNQILLDKKLSFKLIDLCLKYKSSDLEKKSTLVKYVTRKLFCFYDLPLSDNLNDMKDKEILRKLKFHNLKLENIFNSVDLVSF